MIKLGQKCFPWTEGLSSCHFLFTPRDPNRRFCGSLSSGAGPEPPSRRNLERVDIFYTRPPEPPIPHADGTAGFHLRNKTELLKQLCLVLCKNKIKTWFECLFVEELKRFAAALL